MPETQNLVRVILRSDGSVHTVFRDTRSIYATPGNLIELFSDPIEFIETRSLIYQDSTGIANRNRVDIEDVLGLTLATVNTDKVVSFNFPELFKYISDNADEQNRNRPLSMCDFEYKTLLSDEKAFLLKYFLEFTKNLKSRVGISKNIKLRNEVQIAIMREILNAYFEEELPEATKSVDLSKKIELGATEAVYNGPHSDPLYNKVTVREYARIIGMSEQTVRNYIRGKKLKSTIKEGNLYYIDKDDCPLQYDKRKGRKRTKTGEEKFFKRAIEESPEMVREYIRKNEIFSDEIGKYIRTYAEVDYYRKESYHDVEINGRHCLILDVNPDYIVPEKMIPQKARNRFKEDADKVFRNRDLMEAGCAPVVPEKQKDQHLFHLHHIGQRTDSPFCTIPDFIHNSKEHSSIFHQGASPEELNRPEFDVIRSSFWKEYIKQYDLAGDFNKIPYQSYSRARKNK